MAGIIEIRQYRLHENRRDDLIALFDREFIEPQEAAGMAIVGQFRVAGDPNRFFWIRAFRDMETRAQSLADFYERPVWHANRDAANETMIDSDDVLLLRPATARSGVDLEGLTRPPRGATGDAGRAFVSMIFDFDAPVEDDFIGYFDTHFGSTMKRLGMEPVALLVTERSANNYPKLPVRERANAFLALSTAPGESSFGIYAESLRRWEKSNDAFARKLRDPVAISRLIPTSRSLLR